MSEMLNINIDNMLAQALAFAPPPPPAPPPIEFDLIGQSSGMTDAIQDMGSRSGPIHVGGTSISENLNRANDKLGVMLEKRAELQDNFDNVGKALSERAANGVPLTDEEVNQLQNMRQALDVEARTMGKEIIELNNELAAAVDSGAMDAADAKAAAEVQQGMAFLSSSLSLAGTAVGLPGGGIDAVFGGIDMVMTAKDLRSELTGEGASGEALSPLEEYTIRPLDMTLFDQGLDAHATDPRIAGLKDDVHNDLNAMSEFARRGHQDTAQLSIMADLVANGIGEAVVVPGTESDPFAAEYGVESTELYDYPKLMKAAEQLRELGYTVGQDGASIDLANEGTLLDYFNTMDHNPADPTKPPVGFIVYAADVDHNVPGVNNDENIRPNLWSPTSPTPDYIVDAVMGGPFVPPQ